MSVANDLATAAAQLKADADKLHRLALSGGLVSRTVDSGTTTEMTAEDYEVVIDKDVSAAHAVALPPAPIDAQRARVSDGKGDLDVDVNNITVSGADGEPIDGQPHHVLKAAFQSQEYVFRAKSGMWNKL